MLKIITFLALFTAVFFQACSTFNYKTYDEKTNEHIDDPEPNYKLTLDEDFQDFTSYMFIGNRIENFGTYFNTYFNALENFDNAYEDYVTRDLVNYNERIDTVFAKPNLSQEAKDNFNKAIEKASKVIQYHKSSEFMDKAVLLVGKSYYYLGDYLKAERKFGEFASRLSSSKLLDEALLFHARTQLRLDNEKPALERLQNLIKTSKDKQVVSESYQTVAEYYLSKKDYESSIKNFKKAIKLSSDNEFKAQMQFIVASVTARLNPKSAVREFSKVLDYDTSFDLEYLARFNYSKNLILSNDFAKAQRSLEDLEVSYKDNPEFLGKIYFLKGTYYEQKGDNKRALNQYYFVITNYPSSVPSSDASFRIARYYENKLKDYLNSYRYYKYSTEQGAGTYSSEASRKIEIFKKYFELQSKISGSVINTDYDNEFKIKTGKEGENGIENKEKGDEGEGIGKPSGLSGTYYYDSLETSQVDSARIKEEEIAKSKFELAELFLYDLSEPDSSEYYLNQAFEQSGDYDFKAKVLFALADLFRTLNNEAKSEEVLRQIIREFPNSTVANSTRALLSISAVNENTYDSSDSLFFVSEEKFVAQDYEAALSGFKEIIVSFPGSKHLDKALYACGWIYENILMNPDSAYFYYSSLVKAVPDSEAASLISGKVSAYESFKAPVDSTVISNDSLKNEPPPLEENNIQKIENKSEELKEENPETPMKKEEGAPVEDPTGNEK
ncbi:MAG: tetratricopeptide repeat protein [Chlorobi bacterium]|nr:tetratricopeptide repeat protein [Chlorobiota bacterium]MCI0714816.1 tetratricopeptide repeat protein [Chlorobiota bacterium]